MSGLMPPRTWPEDRYPSPAEWVAWFEAASPDERMAIAGRVMDASSRGAVCIERDHQRRICALETARDTQYRAAQELASRVVEAESAIARARRYAEELKAEASTSPWFPHVIPGYAAAASFLEALDGAS